MSTKVINDYVHCSVIGSTLDLGAIFQKLPIKFKVCLLSLSLYLE